MSASEVYTRDSDRCPLSGGAGKPLRSREGAELGHCYDPYFGNALPEGMLRDYFQSTVQEYHSPESDLRWFSPAPIAGPEFYQLMARTYPWYYSPETWDKHYTLGLFRRLGIRRFVEVGCGDGLFLGMARDQGVEGLGIDTNREALERARSQGLEVMEPEAYRPEAPGVDACVMLQVLEHVPEPLDFLRNYVEQCQPKRLIIAVPSHETLLAQVSDPLAWPPHHVTMWSRRSFEYAGQQLGYRLVETAFPPMTYGRFVELFNKEPSLETPLGRFRPQAQAGAASGDWISRLIRRFGALDARLGAGEGRGLMGKIVRYAYRRFLRGWAEPEGLDRRGPWLGRTRWMVQRLLGRPWALRDFWILVVLEREQ